MRRFESLLVAVILVLMVLCASPIQAGEWSTTAYKGTVVKANIAAGDKWIVYYNPDGTYPTLYAEEPAIWWSMCIGAGKQTPATTLDVYIWSSRYGWVKVNGYMVTPLYPAKLTLYGVKGTQYKFVISNYDQVTPISLLVK